MRHLEVTRDSRDGAIRVAVAGQLDMATAERLESELRAAEAEGPEELVLDYSGLGFMDSTGLQVLLDADARAREGGWRLRVVLGTGEAARVARLADVVDRLSVADVTSSE